MTVASGYFELSDEQRRFVSLLKRWPSLLRYWNFEQQECDIPALEKRMGTMSHGEQIMASFFLGVWLHNAAARSNFVDAMSTLDDIALQMITD